MLFLLHLLLFVLDCFLNIWNCRDCWIPLNPEIPKKYRDPQKYRYFKRFNSIFKVLKLIMLKYSFEYKYFILKHFLHTIGILPKLIDPLPYTYLKFNPHFQVFIEMFNNIFICTHWVYSTVTLICFPSNIYVSL